MKKVFLIILTLLFLHITADAKSFGTGIEAVRKSSLGKVRPLQIRAVQTNSPAAAAGIPENWYIISINGEKTDSLSDIQCLSLLNNSEKITLTVSQQEISNALNEKTVILSNREGFTNTIKSVLKKKGIGISIYKYNLDLSMPLLITNVEHGSPAELNGIKKNSLIQKINSVSTINLSEKECLKLINNSKKLNIEITDLEGNNSKIYSLEGKDYFLSDIKNAEKDGILSKSMIGFAKYNSIDRLLSEYFKTVSPNHVRVNKKTNKEIRDEDIKKIEEPYLQYKSNQNDMAFNKYLYDGINTFIWQYKELKKWHIQTVKDILVYYGKLNKTASEQEVLNYVKTSDISNKNYYLDAISFYDKSISSWDKWAKEIYNYSLSYETKQKKSATKITTPYFIDNVDFREILWGWNIAKQPQKNGIYVISKGSGAKVLQSVIGGILVTAEPSKLSSNARVIYITTKRQFADGDWIKENLFIVFEGYYSYINTLGVNRKIYKFKEVPQAEYWNRVKTNIFYFIK